MAKTAVIRVNADRSLCDVDLRPEGTPEDEFGELFGGDDNEYPDSSLFAFDAETGEAYLAVFEGAEIGVEEDTVYQVEKTGTGYLLTELPTEVEEIDDDDFGDAEPEFE